MWNNEVNNILSLTNITSDDLRLVLNTAQLACGVLAAGLGINWFKTRHPGVLLSCVLYGAAAYTSYFGSNNNDWWPLLVAFGSSWALKNMGYHMGYH
jgi:hypothetical protein